MLVLRVVADVLELFDEFGIAVRHALHAADGLLRGAAGRGDRRGDFVDACRRIVRHLGDERRAVLQRAVRAGGECVEAVLCVADGGGGLGEPLARVRGGRLHAVERLACGLRLPRHAGEFRVEVVDGGPDGRDVVAGCVQLVDGVVRDVSGFARETAAGGVHGFGEHFADGGDEGVVDGAVDGGGALVGDFRRDRAGFFVDVVFERRTVRAVGHDVGEVFAEIVGDDDRGVAVAGLHRLHRLGLAHEPPAELVVLLQGAFDLLAEVDFAEQFVVGALVGVGDGHIDAVGVAVWVPESVDVEPCVQRRNHDQTDHDHPCRRHGDQPFDVAAQYLQYVVHGFSGLRTGDDYGTTQYVALRIAYRITFGGTYARQIDGVQLIVEYRLRERFS